MWENIARADQAGYTDPKVSLAAFLVSASVTSSLLANLLTAGYNMGVHSALLALCTDPSLRPLVSPLPTL